MNYGNIVLNMQKNNGGFMKTIVITGANSGIGREAALLEAKNGNRVFLICRNKVKGAKTLAEIKESSKNDNVELIIIDLNEKKSITEGAKCIKEKTNHIDVLIHNAAIFDIGQNKPEYNHDNIESILFTNFLGPILLNHLLEKELKASKMPRVIVISSKGLIAKPFLRINYKNPEYRNSKFSVARNYYQSKLALCIWTQFMASMNKQITYNAIRVTNVRVDVTRYSNISNFYKKMYELKSRKALEPKEMAKTYLFVAESNSLDGLTGKYITEQNRMKRMPAVAYRQEEWKKLNTVIEKYLGNLS